MNMINEAQIQTALHVAAVPAAYVTAFGAANWLWLRRSGVEITPAIAGFCFLPALLCLLLGGTTLDDYQQYVARIIACAMFAPVLLLFWSTSLTPAAPRPVWPFAAGACAVHAAAFVAAILWMGTVTTRVPAAAGAIAVDVSTLRSRLLSLNGPDAPFEVAVDGNSTVVRFRAREGAGRYHAAILDLNATTHEVRVRERLSAIDARPESARETRMAGPADGWFNPTRPNATTLSGTTAQTTMIEPERLSAVPLILHGGSASAPPSFTASQDGGGMVTMLCAVVTRSGWNWQPAFFGGN